MKSSKRVKPSQNPSRKPHISVIVPTYKRETVLLDTLNHLRNLTTPQDEIVVVDQTLEHDSDTLSKLEQLNDNGWIRWIRLQKPSIAHAMNVGMLKARNDIVLFLDDDIVPDQNLLEAHRRAHQEQGVTVVAGKVMQPWDSEGVEDGEQSGQFTFTSSETQWINEFMGGNFSVRRSEAIRVGGVDENFVEVAYRFERDLAERLLAAGNRILYEPGASIYHLKAQEGGTRVYRRRITNPGHSVGDYYHMIRSKSLRRRPWEIIKRTIGSILTRYHMLHPWWIPVTLFVELAGLVWAAVLTIRGPRYIHTGNHAHTNATENE